MWVNNAIHTYIVMCTNAVAKGVMLHLHLHLRHDFYNIKFNQI
jgi:hypothetical protein